MYRVIFSIFFSDSQHAGSSCWVWATREIRSSSSGFAAAAATNEGDENNNRRKKRENDQLLWAKI